MLSKKKIKREKNKSVAYRFALLPNFRKYGSLLSANFRGSMGNLVEGSHNGGAHGILT